jgi:hypothetical protein
LCGRTDLSVAAGCRVEHPDGGAWREAHCAPVLPTKLDFSQVGSLAGRQAGRQVPRVLLTVPGLRGLFSCFPWCEWCQWTARTSRVGEPGLAPPVLQPAPISVLVSCRSVSLLFVATVEPLFSD